MNLAASLFREEEYTKQEKLEVLNKMEHASTKDAERVIDAHSIKPKKKRKERMKELADDEFELLTLINKETHENLKKLKGLIAHKHPKITIGELLQMVTEETLKKWDPAQQKYREIKKTEKGADTEICVTEKTSRQFSVKVKREVWRRSESKCEKCASTHALQIDHIKPRALGGTNDLSNLRLLCRKCNQRSAIKVFGSNKMQNYFEKE